MNLVFKIRECYHFQHGKEHPNRNKVLFHLIVSNSPLNLGKRPSTALYSIVSVVLSFQIRSRDSSWH